MAFRLLRICDSEEMFEGRLTELKKDFLMPRNYSSKVVETQFERIRNLSGSNYSERRTLALQKKNRNIDPRNANRVKFPLDFHPVLPAAGPVLKRHHRTMITDNPELAEPFPDPPMACLRQGAKIKTFCVRQLCLRYQGNPHEPHTRLLLAGGDAAQQGGGSAICAPPLRSPPHPSHPRSQDTLTTSHSLLIN